ncbi:MAG: 3-isopropylmalate dehydratase [miscellaneous Crenarchaeota group-6 archaeon AD8-1]|nr:MAG: 3-isopropylmalate dehydratase [miscellaneous Crenarchaeota group-6 archaeon AD8-1]
MKISGKAIKFGKDIDTDVILPGKYLVLVDPKELAKHAMEGIDPDFPKKAEKGIIIVSGKNFGCGSSREQAPLALKYAGVKCVIAESFARIFFRNSINIGLPVIECEGISNLVNNDDDLTVDLLNGIVQNNSNNQIINGIKLPQFIIEILDDGGLIENLRRRINK